MHVEQQLQRRQNGGLVIDDENLETVHGARSESNYGASRPEGQGLSVVGGQLSAEREGRRAEERAPTRTPRRQVHGQRPRLLPTLGRFDLERGFVLVPPVAGLFRVP